MSITGLIMKAERAEHYRGQLSLLTQMEHKQKSESYTSFMSRKAAEAQVCLDAHEVAFEEALDANIARLEAKALERERRPFLMSERRREQLMRALEHQTSEGATDALLWLRDGAQ